MNEDFAVIAGGIVGGYHFLTVVVFDVRWVLASTRDFSALSLILSASLFSTHHAIPVA
jgi:hypothetical protein